ncbi:sensor histidine kinase [Lampropedia puyangensis]|uniref:Sensor histidine kinase n=1 Tax=Lampropedia puyangensis TaxID=1330072 RepID=A0A4S8FAT6_9BURK|nr:histidine kinase [Lampropedia puyangensis]THU04417.1 sensor histidine kinase [Lampropedia puyangensis]
MNGTKRNILSARAPRAAPAALVLSDKPSLLLFDACHLGVVLRALLLVETPLALIVLFQASTLQEWLGQFAILTGVSMPAVLLWLLLSCLCKHWLNQQVASVQWGFALLLGLMGGLLGMGLFDAFNIHTTTKAAWLAACLSGTGLAALLTSMLVMRQRARQPAQTVAKLAELQSRIRPHFLFNTLNSAIALVRQNPRLAEGMLEDLSDLFHHALKDARSTSSLEKEVEIARQYLRIEGIRFEARLRTSWTIEQEALQASVPPLLLQPLVENAIKHGIEPSVDGGEIHILVRRKGDRVLVRISNTVPNKRSDCAVSDASPKTAGNGIALRNVRARLRLMHDVHADFSARTRGDRYEVAISLPAAPLMGRDDMGCAR